MNIKESKVPTVDHIKILTDLKACKGSIEWASQYPDFAAAWDAACVFQADMLRNRVGNPFIEAQEAQR